MAVQFTHVFMFVKFLKVFFRVFRLGASLSQPSSHPTPTSLLMPPSNSPATSRNKKAIEAEALHLCMASWRIEGASSDDRDFKVGASQEGLREARRIEAVINVVLYGPSNGRRLPVFKEICPSSRQQQQ